ncbi:UNVERIFIED_CONTAM: DNA-binding MarR family transcriptional regulator [Brevibacillus sp. OAP136]
MNVNLQHYIGLTIHQTDLLVSAFVKNNLAPLNLAPAQSLILALLLEQDGLTQNEIAEKMLRDKTNVARMVANLEGKGFVRRATNQSDRRLLHVHLTETGRELAQSIIPIYEDIHHTICQGVSQEELDFLHSILLKLRRNLP